MIQAHQLLICWVEFMICYVWQPAPPPGCLHAAIDLRDLRRDGQVAGCDPLPPSTHFDCAPRAACASHPRCAAFPRSRGRGRDRNVAHPLHGAVAQTPLLCFRLMKIRNILGVSALFVLQHQSQDI